MRVYVRMYVHVYACVRVRMSECVHTCVCACAMCMHACMYAWMQCACMCAMCMHACMCACICAGLCACVHACRMQIHLAVSGPRELIIKSDYSNIIVSNTPCGCGMGVTMQVRCALHYRTKAEPCSIHYHPNRYCPIPTPC